MEIQLPCAVSEWGWKYHHTGIPVKYKLKNERYIPHLKMFVSGFETSPFGVEWMRFETGSPVHPLVREIPHVAFEVTDIDAELKKRKFNVLTAPESPMDKIRVAMIEHDGAPIELIEFNHALE